MKYELMILGISSSIYLLRIAFFLIGFFREYFRNRKFLSSDFEPRVSVIVPARNEEENIEQCINSLSKLDYPNDKLEIVAINDRSEDKTKEILDGLAQKYSNLRVIHIENESQKFNIPGKAGAIQVGAEAATGDVVFQTDADCTVNPKWVKQMVKVFKQPETGFVSAYTNIDGKRLFDKVQAIEWIYMNTMGTGGIGMNQILGCYGNNASFRKKFFDLIGGYRKIKFSVAEDLALQQAFFKNGYKVHYLVDPNTMVTTKPCKNFKEYLQQHHRWTRGGLNLRWRAAIFVLSSFAIWFGLLFFAYNLDFFHFATLLLLRFTGDLLLLIPPLITLKKKSYFLYFPFAVPFFLLVELLAPFMTLNKNVKWKGQIFRTT
jgi:cellulose synthase/poly-beta-1,6-N-acetylglucosamine synthase-like glycosyltransferase